MRRLAAALCLALPLGARAQLAPSLALQVTGPPVPVFEGGWPACDPTDIPDAPARALRLVDGTIQLYASDQVNRISRGPDLLRLRHDCSVVYRGSWNDDPGAYDDRTWITTPWTDDGKTIWAVLHNEFHGHLRRALCPSGRYMDCWFNALTLGVSADGGRSFRRAPGDAIVAAVPYRYDQVGLGHHGYFNSSNIVRHDGTLNMFTFATQTGVQQGGNCLLRTGDIADPTSWRAWDGKGFGVALQNPYTHALDPQEHVCAPVATGALRWPVTSLTRHVDGSFIALMQNAARDGGVFYATSPDLLRWSAPVRLLAAPGFQNWTCADPAPIAYPSLIDPASDDRNFQTVGAEPVLFATRFEVKDCRLTPHRDLVRWPLIVLTHK